MRRVVGEFASLALAALPQLAYLLLCVMLLAVLLARAFSDTWVGDFWEHAAVVRELVANPLAPHHPMLAVDAPHAFFSPYALGVASLARALRLEPVTALALAGLFNLVLFLAAFRRFVRIFTHEPAAPFYGLLFVLFLWGSSPWVWSGFYHLEAFSYIQPYPSTFAAGLVFLALPAFVSFLRSASRGAAVFLFLAVFSVLLTHPPTALFLLTGFASLGIWLFERHLARRYVALLVLVALAFGAAAVWPYYPFVRLVLSESSTHDSDNQMMYVSVLQQVWPALLGIVALAVRLRRNLRDPLVLLVVGLVAAYIYGGVTEKYTYGRSIAWAVLMLQLALAIEIAQLAPRCIPTAVREKMLTPVMMATVVACVLTYPFAVLESRNEFLQSFESSRSVHQRLSPLADYVSPDDVVITDLETSLYVPIWGGKVVGWPHAVPFVDSSTSRKEDLRAFFTEETTQADRLEILTRYGVRWLLLWDEGPLSPRTQASLRRLGTVVYSDDGRRMTLVAIGAVASVMSGPDSATGLMPVYEERMTSSALNDSTDGPDVSASPKHQ